MATNFKWRHLPAHYRQGLAHGVMLGTIINLLFVAGFLTGLFG